MLGSASFCDQLAFHLFFHAAADFEAHGPLVEKVARGAGEMMLQAVL